MARETVPVIAPQPAPMEYRAAARVTVQILGRLCRAIDAQDVAVRLWDGSRWLSAPAGQSASFTLVLHHPGALRAMLLPPSQAVLGECFLRGDFSVEGDLIAAAAFGRRLLQVSLSRTEWYTLARSLLTLPRPATTEPAPRRRALLRGRLHSRERDRAAVTSHYDVGNAFYALWLDARMVYSCAYFISGAESLDAAQEAKLDLICRKLRLLPGERLLDIGCGWGGLVIYAAQHYGVEAVGITLSEPQEALARQRIDAAGLGKRCRVEIRDYRDLHAAGTFDKVASVGMAEHVGRERLPAYFTAAYRVLRPGGLFLNHAISCASRPDQGPRGWATRAIRLLPRRESFIERYVFPDGELVPIGPTLQAAEASGFEVRDVESLREHYVLTLRHWVRRLDEHLDEARSLVDEQTLRVWRLYLAGCAHAFVSDEVTIYQSLLVRAARDGQAGLPLTRADIYAP